VSACLTVLKFKIVQLIFFASIVYNICLGKYFGSEWVKDFASEPAVYRLGGPGGPLRGGEFDKRDVGPSETVR